MVDIIFDLTKMQTKIFLAFISIMTFSILYMALPKDEFKKIEHFEKEPKNISYFDIIYYSVLSQVGIQNVILYPKTMRATIMTMIQLIIGYSIILI
jgi:hypothetical protein